MKEEGNMSVSRGKVAIVGIGEVPTGRYPDTAAIFTSWGYSGAKWRAANRWPKY